MEDQLFTVNLCTFMGREHNIRILLPYIEKALEVNAIDRYYMIDMTRKMSDHELIHAEQKRLSEKYADRVFIVNGEKQKKLLQSGEKIEGGDWSPFYSFLDTFSDNDIIIKCDDDTMFIDVDTLRAAAELRWKNQTPFLMHANTINNGICAYHQQKKNIWRFPVKGMGTYPYTGLTGPLFADRGELASQCHKQFTSDLIEDPKNLERYKLKENIYFANRVSINFIFMLGKDRHELKKISTQDEYLTSSKLPQKFDRPNMIIGDFVVVHHSYGAQEELLEKEQTIKLYEKLVKEQATHAKPRGITNTSNKTSPIKIGGDYLTASCLDKDALLLQHDRTGKYLIVEGFKQEIFKFKVKGDPKSKYSMGEFRMANKLKLSEKPNSHWVHDNNTLRIGCDLIRSDMPKANKKQYGTFLTNYFYRESHKKNTIFLEEKENGLFYIKDKNGFYLIAGRRGQIYFQNIEEKFIERAHLWRIKNFADKTNSVFTCKVDRSGLDEVENDPTHATIGDGLPLYIPRGYWWSLKNHLWEFIKIGGKNFHIKVINDEIEPCYLASANNLLRTCSKPYKWSEEDIKARLNFDIK
jgi:hypothetical protein